MSRLIHKAKHQIVILIDSVDKLYDIKDIDWLPTELVNNVKIILTVTSTSKNHDDFDSTPLLKALKVKINAQNFLYLSSFTQEQWEDVLTYGSGATNGALQLPESWKKSDEKAPIQAKVIDILFVIELLNSCLVIFRSYGGWHGSDKGS